MTKKQKKVLLAHHLYSGAGGRGELFSIGGVAGTVLAAYLIIGYDILRKAFRGIIRVRCSTRTSVAATVGAVALAVYESGDYLEAVAVMLFYQIGERI